MHENNWTLILDFDSTIITSESLDLLSELILDDDENKRTKLQKIKELTEKGMDGIIPFQDSLDQRLQSIASTRARLIKVLFNNKGRKDQFYGRHVAHWSVVSHPAGHNAFQRNGLNVNKWSIRIMEHKHA